MRGAMKICLYDLVDINGCWQVIYMMALLNEMIDLSSPGCFYPRSTLSASPINPLSISSTF